MMIELLCVRHIHQSFLNLPVHCQMTVMKCHPHHRSQCQNDDHAEVLSVLKFILKRMQHLMSKRFSIQPFLMLILYN